MSRSPIIIVSAISNSREISSTSSATENPRSIRWMYSSGCRTLVHRRPDHQEAAPAPNPRYGSLCQ
ncbi:MAG: hypothetical protein NZ769_09675 [Anaerolineae bacterium]|nr:hypothetical protein [Anaerolineae bacterium]